MINILVVEDDIHIQKPIISSIKEVKDTVQIFNSTSVAQALQIAVEHIMI